MYFFLLCEKFANSAEDTYSYVITFPDLWYKELVSFWYLQSSWKAMRKFISFETDSAGIGSYGLFSIGKYHQILKE
jgi:hypothetical protein